MSMFIIRKVMRPRCPEAQVRQPSHFADFLKLFKESRKDLLHSTHARQAWAAWQHKVCAASPTDGQEYIKFEQHKRDTYTRVLALLFILRTIVVPFSGHLREAAEKPPERWAKPFLLVAKLILGQERRHRNKDKGFTSLNYRNAI